MTDGAVRFVLNTHWHGDHTGGNENFGKAGAMIVAHENVRRRLNPAEFRNVMGRTQQAPPEALPVVTFSDAVNLLLERREHPRFSCGEGPYRWRCHHLFLECERRAHGG